MIELYPDQLTAIFGVRSIVMHVADLEHHDQANRGDQSLQILGVSGGSIHTHW
jgi:hypothetical protein